MVKTLTKKLKIMNIITKNKSTLKDVREKYMEHLLCKGVKELGGKAYKFVSPNCRGVPDRLCVLPDGRIFFVELKSAGKKPSPLQEIEIKRLRELGQEVLVIDNIEGVLDLVLPSMATKNKK